MPAQTCFTFLLISGIWPRRAFLRLNDPIDGHRAVRAGLERGVNHAVGLLMQDMTRDVDTAAVHDDVFQVRILLLQE
jgi:hypothetical protein